MSLEADERASFHGYGTDNHTHGNFNLHYCPEDQDPSRTFSIFFLGSLKALVKLSPEKDSPLDYKNICLGLFSVVMVQHHDQGNLKKKVF